ncbi:OTU domain-containing protein 7B-like isoform X2 [Saccostrea cucullata]|uniref:OTU domain-containing protein 7B-like isoform X2 n=1 Tax=Saccostrea cuccullata TaxID=36930 RepID=UPI002ED36245
MEKKQALRSFIDSTGLEPDLAANILSEVGWDVGQGIRRFEDYIRMGRIKPVYPPPQVSAGWIDGPSQRLPGGTLRSGDRKPTPNLPGHVSGTQWADPYGEVRNPPVERIIPIERMPDKGHSVMFPVNSTQPPVLHHSVLNPRISTPPAVAPKPLIHSWSAGPPPISTNPPGPKLMDPHPSASTPQQPLVNIRPTTHPSQVASTKSTTQPKISDKSVTQPQVVNKPAASQQLGNTKLQNTENSRPLVMSVSVGEPVKIPTTTTGKHVTTSSNSKTVAPSQPVTPSPHVTQPATRSTATSSQSTPTMNELSKKSSAADTKAVTPSPTASPRPLKRGFSKIVENESLVDLARKGLMEDISEDSHDHMYVQTFVLPDLTVFSADYRAFLEKDLIETSTLVSLEQAGRLNWWAEMGICQRLLPMATSGDGNCLLHAASLAMWGIHDRQLMLRKELYETLTKKPYRHALYRRWRWQQTVQNEEAGLIFSEEEWQTEWNSVLKLASTKPRLLPGIRRNSSCCDSPITNSSDDENSPVIYESLEEFHVFVLSHILQRTIVIVADTILKDSMGEALAPIPFGGIYLPLECDPKSCYQSPLLLTYDAAHFSALVPMETDEKDSLPTAIPLVDPSLKILPVHFLVDPGPSYNWETKISAPESHSKMVYSEEDKINLLKSYLQIERLPATHLEYDSDCDRRSGGSYESDDNTKKKDKQGSQQGVTKQFGSLGKSINKKIKKNFGSVGKALKSMGPEQKLSKKGSVGSGLTQSTRVPLTIAAMAEQEQSLVLCAKVSTKQTDVHKEMIKNYMLDARHQFQQDRQKMQARGEEIRRRSMEMDRNNECITPGCKMYGNSETHYMCSKCFNDHKQEAEMQEKYKGGGHLKGKSDGVESYGKSKFYLPTEEEDPKPKANKINTSTSNPVHMAPQKVNLPPERTQAEVRPRPQSFSHGNTTKTAPETDTRDIRSLSNPIRARTPSPDYDNVDYSFRLREIPVTVTNLTPSSPQPNRRPASDIVKPVGQPKAAKPCKTSGCGFYGSPEQNDYCSACYKKVKQRQEQQQLTRV